MSTTVLSTAEASTHLYEALSHHLGNLDMSATDPLVRAIAEYGQRCREHDEAGQAAASEHIYQALTHRFGPMDLAADQPVVRALAEFGEAYRAAGTKA
jgi:hypothetical protein